MNWDGFSQAVLQRPELLDRVWSIGPCSDFSEQLAALAVAEGFLVGVAEVESQKRQARREWLERFI